MTDIEILSGTREMVRVAIDSSRDDIVTGTPEFGVSDSEDVEPGGFESGTWLSEEPTVEEVDGKFVKAYIAQVLISGTGNGGDLELSEGEHYLFTRVAMLDGQRPLRLAGKVKVL